jgi:hypothetical protein
MEISRTRLKEVVRGIFAALAEPAGMRLIEWHIHAFGYWKVDTFDVRDAVLSLEQEGVVEMLPFYRFQLKGRSSC